MLRGPALNRHPCPGSALAASMPLDPLHIACVRPAPKSRFVVSGLACKKIKSQSALLLSQSGLPAAAILRTPPSASPAATRDRGRIENRRSLLIFMRDRSDDTNRDLGAGRTQVALRGPSGMDAARAAPRHGWRMAAGPRSVAGVREPDEGGPNQEQDPLVTWGSFPSNSPEAKRVCRGQSYNQPKQEKPSGTNNNHLPPLSDKSDQQPSVNACFADRFIALSHRAHLSARSP